MTTKSKTKTAIATATTPSIEIPAREFTFDPAQHNRWKYCDEGSLRYAQILRIEAPMEKHLICWMDITEKTEKKSMEMALAHQDLVLLSDIDFLFQKQKKFGPGEYDNPNYEKDKCILATGLGRYNLFPVLTDDKKAPVKVVVFRYDYPSTEVDRNSSAGANDITCRYRGNWKSHIKELDTSGSIVCWLGGRLFYRPR